jgi:hypothetical protein
MNSAVTTGADRAEGRAGAAAHQHAARQRATKAALFTENYKEQLTWRDAATGRLLAESDFFEPTPSPCDSFIHTTSPV